MVHDVVHDRTEWCIDHMASHGHDCLAWMMPVSVLLMLMHCEHSKFQVISRLSEKGESLSMELVEKEAANLIHHCCCCADGFFPCAVLFQGDKQIHMSGGSIIATCQAKQPEKSAENRYRQPQECVALPNMG